NLKMPTYATLQRSRPIRSLRQAKAQLVLPEAISTRRSIRAIAEFHLPPQEPRPFLQRIHIENERDKQNDNLQRPMWRSERAGWPLLFPQLFLAMQPRAL